MVHRPKISIFLRKQIRCAKNYPASLITVFLNITKLNADYQECKRR